MVCLEPQGLQFAANAVATVANFPVVSFAVVMNKEKWTPSRRM